MDGGVTPIGGAVALRLANLLASRLCHDLSGPLGGLGAALGEMADDPDPAALSLAQDAAEVLRRRLALFRAAWGIGPVPLGRAALRDLAAGLPNANRLQLELEGLDETPPFAPAATRAVVSTLLLAAESMPRGGMLALAGNPRGTVIATIAGLNAAWPVGLGAMLASPEAAWAAVADIGVPGGLRMLPGPVMALVAQESGIGASLLMAGRAEAVPPLVLDFSALRTE